MFSGFLRIDPGKTCPPGRQTARPAPAWGFDRHLNAHSRFGERPDKITGGEEATERVYQN
jgi:hypothetical protein